MFLSQDLLPAIRLIHRLVEDNASWGAPNIHGELLKLGFNVSPVTLNHLIVPAHNKHASARFLADLLGLEVEDKSPGSPVGRFAVARVDQTNLDFDEIERFEPHHYAFLVSEAEFDAIVEKLTAAGLSYSADPLHQSVGKMNQNEEGRGLYSKT